MATDRVGDPALAVEAVVSHTTASEVWGIGDLWPDGIHFTVGDRRRSRQPDVQFHRADLADADWTIHPESGLPVTTVTRTIVDLAQADHEPGHLLGLVADAARGSLLDEQELLNALAGQEDALGVDRGDRSGLEELLDDYFPEDRVVRRTRSVVDEALHPVREQIDLLVRSLTPQISLPKPVANPTMLQGLTELPQHGESQPGRQDEVAEGTKGTRGTKDEEDTRPDQHGTEEGGEGSGPVH